VEIQQEFLDIAKCMSKDSKWEMLTARVTPEEKEDIRTFCREVFKLPYSVVTRLLWRRIISNYRIMPQVSNQRTDVITDLDQAAQDVISYLPVILRQRQRHPRNF